MQNRRLLSPGLLFATLLFLTSAAFADDFAYDFTGSNQWGTMDLNTGVFTQLGNTGTLLAGIGTLNGNYYGGQWGGSTLYQVNPANGGLTPVGNGSLTYNDFGSTSAGLYAYERSSTDLYSINATTGASTLIGATGIPNPGGTIGMSAGPGGLYFTSDQGSGSLLYLLNTTTGAPTLIGNTGVPDIGAMAWVNGVLYAGSDANLQVWSINTSTGLGTFVSNTSGGNTAFWGLAPEAVVPEPSSLLLLGTGAAGLIATARRKLAK